MVRYSYQRLHFREQRFGKQSTAGLCSKMLKNAYKLHSLLSLYND